MLIADFFIFGCDVLGLRGSLASVTLSEKLSLGQFQTQIREDDESPKIDRTAGCPNGDGFAGEIT